MSFALRLTITLAVMLPMASATTLHGASNIAVGASKPPTSLFARKSDAQLILEMGRVFDRSEKEHQDSMDQISKSMTTLQAVHLAHKHPRSSTSAFKSIVGLVASGKKLRGNSDGFGGLDGARKLINEMIYDTMEDYDNEVAKCTGFYVEQCALMETNRGEIAGANFMTSKARALILDAEANIKDCERDIPVTEDELKDHNRECKVRRWHQIVALKVIMADVYVMTTILKMSDCDAKGLVQTEKLMMQRCEDECGKNVSVTFKHELLQAQVNKLTSPAAKELVSRTFGQLYAEDTPEDDETEPVEVKEESEPLRPPYPVTKVLSDPCDDPTAGPPSGKRLQKCTLKQSPRCYEIQGKFLQMQAEIEDQRDALMDEMAQELADCTEVKNTLKAMIASDNSLLSESETKLATGTEKLTTSDELGRKTADQNAQYHKELMTQQKICSQNYKDFEMEICALQTIRGNVYKKLAKDENGDSHKGFFQDCKMGPWSPGDCSKDCGGGVQNITRPVMIQPGPNHEPGAMCLPLQEKRKCNLHACPVNCELEEWAGWSKCSAKCGGGVAQRVRGVLVPEKHGGDICTEVSQGKPCGTEACEKDCVLHEWTPWSPCSKDCNSGTQKKVREVKEPVEGAGTCAGKWSKDRLKYKACNIQPCQGPNPEFVMECHQKRDIVLLLDGTPKSGKASWEAIQKQASLFVEAFTNAWFAVIHYTGPRTWSGVSKCTGKPNPNKPVDTEKDCHVTIAQQLGDSNFQKTQHTINALKYQPGSKLLSMALLTAQSAFSLGRPEAKSVVVNFMDGEPLSYRKTRLAARDIRKKARLVFVVLNKFAPLADIKKWVTRRHEENLVVVKTTAEMAMVATGTHVVANICPTRSPRLKMPLPDEGDWLQ